MNNADCARPIAMVLFLGLVLAGCGGPAVLSRERAQEVVSAPLLELRDSRVAVVLDTTVVRGGPGAWARNASWDEYRFRIRSLSGDKPSLTRISLVDALGKGVDASSARGE